MGKPDWRYLGPLVLLAALVGGVQIGRATAPTRTTDRIVTVTDERVTVLRFASTHTWATSWQTRTQDRVVTRWLPGGTVERVEERQAQASGTSAGSVVVEASQDTRERHEAREVVKVLERPVVAVPRLFLGALARPDLRGGLAVASVRLGGPVWVTGAATYERGVGPAGWLGVGWSW